jgi:hypothetical protein
MAVIEDLLVWLLAAYGCSSLLVSLLDRFAIRSFERVGGPLIHYQVLLHNSEHALEGVVRRLMNASIMSGTPIRISFVDHGSTDDTLKITAIFERNYRYAAATTEPDKELTPIMIDLRWSNELESRE